MKILFTFLALFFSGNVISAEKEQDKKYGAWLDDKYFECPTLLDALMNGYELIAYSKIPGDIEGSRYTTYLIKNKEMILQYTFFGVLENGAHHCMRLLNTEEEVLEIIGDRIFEE